MVVILFLKLLRVCSVKYCALEQISYYLHYEPVYKKFEPQFYRTVWYFYTPVEELCKNAKNWWGKQMYMHSLRAVPILSNKFSSLKLCIRFAVCKLVLEKAIS